MKILKFLSGAGDWREHNLLPESIFHWWKAYFVAGEYFLLAESIFCCPRAYFVVGAVFLSILFVEIIFCCPKVYFAAREYFLLVESIFCCPNLETFLYVWPEENRAMLRKIENILLNNFMFRARSISQTFDAFD